MRRPPKPRITKPNLAWKFYGGAWHPFFRMTWTEDGRRKEKAIGLDWQGDPERLDALYWECRAGRHEKQAPAPKYTWSQAIIAWREDPRVQGRLSAGTKKSYRRDMDAIREKNGAKDMRKTTRAAVRAHHASLADTPRKADKRLQTISIIWNYAKDQLDWPLGENPAARIEHFGKQREFLPWPDWMIAAVAEAPEKVRTACELILGTGQRPSAAITMREADFQGDYMVVTDEKAGETFEVACPERLGSYLADRPKRGTHVLARNLTEPLGYDSIEKAFRTWRATLGDEARPYTLHGLRKVAIIQLAEAGCSDAEIQAVTGQSAEMVAYYRRLASRKKLSKRAMNRRDQNGNKT